MLSKTASLITTTVSICPVCKTLVDAQIYSEDGKVFMSKNCPSHGLFASIVSSDAESYRKADRYNLAGKKHLIKRYAAPVEHGCPWDCGLCTNHQQHTCVALIEITNRCDLNCPVCYASANDGKSLADPSMGEIVDQLKFLLTCEFEPPTLVISGGEPMIRRDLIDIVTEARSLGFKSISVNTNGLALSKKPRLAESLLRAGLTEVTISIDGLDDSVHSTLRGVPLLDSKIKAVTNAKNAGLKVGVGVTLVKGVNDDQVGSILRLAGQLRLDGVSFSPIARVGRYCRDFPDAMNHLTLHDVLKAIELQTLGEISASDFVPVPCPDSHCSTLAYAFNAGDRLVPLTRYCDVAEYLDTYGEKPSDPMVAKALENLWSMSAVPGSAKVLGSIRDCCPSSYEANGEVMSIMVHAFQDPWTFDLNRCMKCCIHMVTMDHKLIPFCVYNNLYRPR